MTTKFSKRFLIFN